jgi:secreted PhoX family phosphatase
MKYDVLFVGGVDMVYNKNGQSAIAKEWHDFTGYIPIDGRSDSGYVIVNHERIQADATNGDGGGMTVFTAKYDKSSKKWMAVDPGNGRKFRNVDFSAVGGTGANCGGIQTAWGKIFTAEEWGSAFNPIWGKDQGGNDSLIASGNEVIHKQGAGITDTSDFTVVKFNGTTVNRSIKKHMNFQYMVEVDVANAKAVRKNYNMGRYDHEGGWIAADQKTVYLSDDASSGSVLFKFVADAPKNFEKGKLYAYKQSSDGNSGSWLAIPMNLDSCMYARDVALRMGATIFMRLEWVDGKGDLVYITETGRGKKFNIKGAMDKGGVPAKHLTTMADWDNNAGTATDLYGRVLRLNTTNDKIDILLEGGGALDGNNTPTGNHLSSPDGLALTEIDGKTWLVINEDMNPSGMPANPSHFGSKLNEIYFLDISGDATGKAYQVSDLHRFLVGPKSCETTGGRFTPDGMTYFVNIQHPSSGNTAPFNHSVTIAVTGFDEYLTSGMEPNFDEGSNFQVWPNPVSGYLFMNKTTDVRVINLASGAVVKVNRGVESIDISDLSPGTYAVQTVEGDVQRIVVQ